MITLYGIRSPHVARVRAALLKKGLEFQHVSVNKRAPSSEWMRLTPIGKIPVLEDNGTIIFDSIHIIEYLDFKYPETYQMLSKDAGKRAKELNVIDVCDEIMRFIRPFYIEKFNVYEPLKNSPASHNAVLYDEKQKSDFIHDVETKLQWLNKELNGKEYFTDSFSAADATVLSLLGTLKYFEINLGELESYFSRLMQDETISNMNASEDEKGVKEI